MTTKREPQEETLGAVLMRWRDERWPDGISAGAFHTEFIRTITYPEPSDTTLANYHVGKVKKPDVEIVEALLRFYDKPLRELPEALRTRVLKLRDRLAGLKIGSRFHAKHAHAA